MGKSLRVQLAIQNESEGTIALQGFIEVPRMPAVGDRFTHNNIKDGRAVKLYGEVMKLVPQPSQTPFDALAVVRILSMEELRPSQA
jgi:hypothetical protein